MKIKMVNKVQYDGSFFHNLLCFTIIQTGTFLNEVWVPQSVYYNKFNQNLCYICRLSYNLTVPMKRKMLLPSYCYPHIQFISEVVRENMEYSIPQLCSLTRLKGLTLSLVCK